MVILNYHSYFCFMIIKYLKHNQIDKTKWDYCVENSANCIVYGMSWYLDIVCENWDALVSDDYEAVMPLPWKSKLGIKYIYHPFFAQQLGLFYQNHADDQVYEFLQKIPSKFLKYETSINYLNQVKKLSLNIKTNHILGLNKNYGDLYSSFSQNTKRNIKKAEKNSPIVHSSITIPAFLTLKKQNNVNHLSETHFNILEKLFTKLINNKHAKIIGISTMQNELLGAALFVSFKKRIIYLFSASSMEGKDQKVMFAILNKVIKEHAGQNKVIDFEGSMIEGVARFFKGFGAVTETYYRVSKSKIPFIK